MKILQYGLTNHLGGIETYLDKITCELHGRENIEFHFLIVGYEKPCFYDKLLNMGCKFYFVTPRKQNILKNNKELKKIFKKEKFDVCHFHLNSLSYFWPVRLATSYCENVIVHSRNSQVKLNKLSKIFHIFNYHSIPRKCKLLAVSDLAGKWMFGKRPYRVINNGINLEKYHFTIETRNNIRNKLEIEGNIVLTNIGAFRYQKNHTFLIDVFSNLVKLNNNYILLLIGSGELLLEIKDKVNKFNLNENVIFLGQRKDIPEILSASDAFLFPSFYEGFPNALLESYASNLISFYSDSITKDININNLGNRISLEKNSEQWANIIHNKLKEQYQREKYEDFENLKNYSLKKEIDTLLKIYRGNING